MGRRLRFIPPGGALVEVTNRTVQGRFLLRPSTKLNRLLIGVLGRAQRLYGVKIHACVVLSNHYHLLLTVDTALQLARFVGYFQGNLAKEAGRLYGWRGPFWHRRFQHILVSEEETAQVARLRYILANSCKEDLVSSPMEWPGVSSTRPLLLGEDLQGIWVDRTSERVASLKRSKGDASAFRMPESVAFDPIPSWQFLQPKLVRQRIAALVAEIEVETLARHRDHQTRPLGKRSVLSQNPHDRPARSKWSPAPLAHCASRETRHAFREAYSSFVSAFHEAAERLRCKGVLKDFPKGAFPPSIPFQQHARAPG